MEERNLQRPAYLLIETILTTVHTMPHTIMRFVAVFNYVTCSKLYKSNVVDVFNVLKFFHVFTF